MSGSGRLGPGPPPGGTEVRVATQEPQPREGPKARPGELPWKFPRERWPEIAPRTGGDPEARRGARTAAPHLAGPRNLRPEISD